MVLEPEVETVLQRMETTVKLYGDQLNVLMQKIDQMSTAHQTWRAEMDDQFKLNQAQAEAWNTQMVEQQQQIDRLEEATVALINIAADLQPQLQALNNSQSMQVH